MYYSGRIFTYKINRTTVTVGAPSMMAMSTSPASSCAFSLTPVAAGSSAAGAAAGTVLPLTAGARGSTTVVDRCVNCDKSSSTVGAGLWLLSAGSPTVSRSPPSPWSTGSEGEISCKQRNFVVSIHDIEDKYTTTLLECFTSWDVVCDLQLFGNALSRHIVRPPRRRRQTSLQTSWRILDERNIG
jgi:hypothetical protein